jgi:hypothetical protein
VIEKEGRFERKGGRCGMGWGMNGKEKRNQIKSAESVEQLWICLQSIAKHSTSVMKLS